jgi:plasmid maintenance system antidote protein VapI
MRLDAWLSLKGVTQTEFAKRLNTTSATIHRIISGSQNIPLSMADAILRETDGAVTPDDLHAVYAETQARSAA